MTKVLAGKILQQYGLQARQVRDVEKGYRNHSYAAELADGRTVNLILYKREEGILKRIQNANYVSNFLANQGFPARKTADPRIIKIESGAYTKFAALYEYLPGATIPWEAYTMKHIKALGAAQSDMHFLLGSLGQKKLPLIVNECEALTARMQKYFAEPGVKRALAIKLKLNQPKLQIDFKKYSNLPAQPLHMDFVRGNILFDQKAAITGVLDFEKAAWGPPVFDVARTLAFLLVDCKYKDEAKVRKYFLHSGYNKRGQANFSDWPHLEELVDFFLLYDFYKFLRHNPYEALEDNEHFARTRDFLLKRNILSRPEMLK